MKKIAFLGFLSFFLIVGTNSFAKHPELEHDSLVALAPAGSERVADCLKQEKGIHVQEGVATTGEESHLHLVEVTDEEAATLQKLLAMENNNGYKAMRVKLLLEQHQMMRQMQEAVEKLGGDKKKTDTDKKEKNKTIPSELAESIRDGLVMAPKIALKWGVGLPAGVLGAIAVGRATIWFLIKTGAVGWAIKTAAGTASDIAVEACDKAFFDKGYCSAFAGWFGVK